MTSTPIALPISPSLKFTGLVPSPSGSQVANFLGIPYATIPARFRQAQPLPLDSSSKSSGGVIDATAYAPRCPQPPDPPRVERRHLYAGSVAEVYGEEGEDEFGCLKLNIYSPVQALGLEGKEKKSLPVLVWIHGGGWTMGDGNGTYTGEYLVRHSIEQGKPFIYVGINYRLGYFGWLSSKELKEEALKNGEVGWTNQGLHDQRLALQWVQKYIHFFGGDASNITIAGESAGAWSVLAHLRSNVPVCQRGIIMSCPSWKHPSSETSQETFDKLVAATGVSESAPGEEKLAALRDLPSQDLVELLGGHFVSPNWDPEWFVDQDPDIPMEKFSNFSPWVKGVVIGHMRDEMALFRLHFKWSTKEAIQEALSSSIEDQSFAQEILDVYGISSADNDADAVRGFVKVCSDGFFARPPYTIGEMTSIPVHVLRFDQTEVHEGTTLYGWAHHSLENAYTCRMPALAGPYAVTSCRDTADAFSKMYIDFVYGNSPWETYAEAGKIMVFDGEKTGLSKSSQVEIWRSLLRTKEREEMFGAMPRILLRKRGAASSVPAKNVDA